MLLFQIVAKLAAKFRKIGAGQNSGLQIRLRRFDSGPGLQDSADRAGGGRPRRRAGTSAPHAALL